MRILWRLLQRLLVVAVGAVTVWLIVFVVFDFADRRLPWAIALAVTYGIAAYVVLPRAIRLGLRILQRGRVPSYTLTGDGLPGDPVNIGLIGTRRQLCEAFAAMGWSEADPLGLTSSIRMVRAFVLNETYPTAPFSTLTCLDEVRISAFSCRSTTVRASDTTFASGAVPLRAPSR